MKILFNEDIIPYEGIPAEFERAAEAILRYQGVDPARVEISVSFVTESKIQELNKEYRGIDKETDVLSFPQLGYADTPKTGPEMLGDVVICTTVAAAHAEEYGHSAQREVVYLFVHSVFHLLGYDHLEYEAKKLMRAAEKSVLIELGYENEEGDRLDL
jgi:probable rRNA maturation factor